MKNIFMKNIYEMLPYVVCNSNGIILPPAKTSQIGAENIHRPKIWQMLPDELKEFPTVNIIKIMIEHIKLNFIFRLCQKYLLNVSYF